MANLLTIFLCVVLPIFGIAWMALVFYWMTKGKYKGTVKAKSSYSQGDYVDEPDYIIDDEPYHHYR